MCFCCCCRSLWFCIPLTVTVDVGSVVAVVADLCCCIMAVVVVVVEIALAVAADAGRCMAVNVVAACCPFAAANSLSAAVVNLQVAFDEW